MMDPDLADRPAGAKVKQPWSQYSFVQVFVTNLPTNVTTLEIYENLKKHGNITRINILESRRDGQESRHAGQESRCEVRFEPPPPAPIWPRKLRFMSNSGHESIIHVRLSEKQPKNFKVESPIRRGVEYNEKIEVLANIILFGALLEPQRMMSCTSRGEPGHLIRMVLDLRKKQIDIFFPSWITSDHRRARRAFRFHVPLDEDFTVWTIPRQGYILHLQRPPWYSKQLEEAVAQTHSPDAKRWSEEDRWARQTDIVEHKTDVQYLNQTPISLLKNFNNINIARWTTFRIKTLRTPQNLAADRIFRDALKDFNVELRDGSGFEVERGPNPPAADVDAWSLINGNVAGNERRSFLEELSGFTLAFPVRYQLEVCLSHGWLHEYSIKGEFMKKLSETPPEKAKQMLVFLDSYQEREFDPMSLFTKLKYSRPVKLRSIPEGCMETRSAVVTATTILFNTPAVEVTNRIIRKYRQYADRFLRVKFEDDICRGQSRLYSSSNNRMILVLQRVKRAMRYGIKLGEMHFEFLAWGNSQLREHGAYFFARTGTISASSIRAEMGAFDQEKVVAKRAARMGQCFSTTKAVILKIPPITKMNTIADITNGQTVGRVTYTDGVGQMSVLAARLAHQQLKIKGPVPSAFQFRLGGCKGVLAVWPELTGIEVKVRESQFKFNSTSNELEVIRWSEFWQPFLNRQIIICLSDLGVPDHVFLRMQDETIAALNAAMNSDQAALKALRDNVDPNGSTLALCALVAARFRSTKEPFVVSLMHLWRAWTLKYLKEKAKIPVPKGAFVLGVADETGKLRGHFANQQASRPATLSERIEALPEIFIQVTNPQTGDQQIVSGPCLLARNPSLHRGDIRMVNAVDKQELRHLCDVVVMPTNGDRDLPSMCSGGDLDGDDYIVIWDEHLIPRDWNAEPFHYEPPPPKTATEEITTNHIIDFFYDYLNNDYLGRIAHAHLAAADFLDDGIQSQACLDLVHLHSMAVDYPKTGVPAIMPRGLERNSWPHFMEKKGNRYISRKILGQLYDAVERVAFNPIYSYPFDARILNAGKPTEAMMQSIREVKHDYDNALQRIMAQHDIKTEFEVWSTFVLDHSKASQDYKFHEEIGRLSKALKDQYEAALVELAGSKEHEHLAPIAIAAYQYTAAQVQTGLAEVKRGLRMEGVEGMPFISFPWLLQDTLCVIAQSVDERNGESRTAYVQNGRLVNEAPDIKLDAEGRALIEVLDEFDVQLPASLQRSHLPDPLSCTIDLGDDKKIFEGVEMLAAKKNDEPTDHPFRSSMTKDRNEENVTPLLIDLDDDPPFVHNDALQREVPGAQANGSLDRSDTHHKVLNGNESQQIQIAQHRIPFQALREQLDREGYPMTHSQPERIRKWLVNVEGTHNETREVSPTTTSSKAATPQEPLADPFEMSAEQMKNMGLNDDLELDD